MTNGANTSATAPVTASVLARITKLAGIGAAWLPEVSAS
jgi:hypothetical protein